MNWLLWILIVISIMCLVLLLQIRSLLSRLEQQVGNIWKRDLSEKKSQDKEKEKRRIERLKRIYK